MIKAHDIQHMDPYLDSIVKELQRLVDNGSVIITSKDDIHDFLDFINTEIDKAVDEKSNALYE